MAGGRGRSRSRTGGASAQGGESFHFVAGASWRGIVLPLSPSLITEDRNDIVHGLRQTLAASRDRSPATPAGAQRRRSRVQRGAQPPRAPPPPGNGAREHPGAIGDRF